MFMNHCSGEILKMTHVARGIDADGVLNVDVIMSGEVPVLPDHANIVVLPYTEDYIQTGPGLCSDVFNILSLVNLVNLNLKSCCLWLQIYFQSDVVLEVSPCL